MEGEQLVSRIDDIFNREDVKEVGITLDVTLPEVLCVEGVLGMAKRCLKTLFRYAIVKLHELRNTPTLERPVQDIQGITRSVLLVKGDFPLAFALRKEAVLQRVWNVPQEIHFTAILFTLHPKCPSGWQHRRWCITQYKPDLQLSCSQIETERELCRAMAEKYPKNYYAWMHRLWLLPLMSIHQLEDELSFTQSWLHGHVSDHSAVNHRIQVLRQILSDPVALEYITSTGAATGLDPDSTVGGAREALFSRMLSECEVLLTNRPGQQSLWYLRRTLAEMQLTFIWGSVTVNHTTRATHNRPTPGPSNHNDEYSQQLLQRTQLTQRFISVELAFAERCCEVEAAAWNGDAQAALARRYAQFLWDRAARHCGVNGPVEGQEQDSRVIDNPEGSFCAWLHGQRALWATKT